MDVRHIPVRQCIGCRIVASKERLLRFMKTPSGTAVFDGDNKHPGRGFYLCPDEKCLREAFRNKRIRAEYFRKRESVDEVIREVQDIILKAIEKNVKLCEKMGYLHGIPEDEKLIRGDDLVLISYDNPPEEKANVHTTALSRGLKTFYLPSIFEEGSRGFLVHHGCPMISMLEMDLQKYGKLSSKGLAV